MEITHTLTDATNKTQRTLTIIPDKHGVVLHTWGHYQSWVIDLNNDELSLYETDDAGEVRNGSPRISLSLRPVKVVPASGGTDES